MYSENATLLQFETYIGRQQTIAGDIFRIFSRYILFQNLLRICR